MSIESPHSEQELLHRLKNNDEAAFTEIFEQYWEKLYAIAYNRLRVRQAAEDVVQEVLSSLWLRRMELVIKHPFQPNFIDFLQKQKILSY